MMGFSGDWRIVRAPHHGSRTGQAGEAGLEVPVGERANIAAYLDARRQRLVGWQRRFLASTSTGQLLEVFKEFGIRDEQMLMVLPGVSSRTLRRWRSAGDTEPDTAMAASRWEELDNLRSIVCYLLADGSYDEAGITAWLRSRQPELGLRRPLDVLGEGDFEEVLKAAESALASSPATEGDLLAPDPDTVTTP